MAPGGPTLAPLPTCRRHPDSSVAPPLTQGVLSSSGPASPIAALVCCRRARRDLTDAGPYAGTPDRRPLPVTFGGKRVASIEHRLVQRALHYGTELPSSVADVASSGCAPRWGVGGGVGVSGAMLASRSVERNVSERPVSGRRAISRQSPSHQPGASNASQYTGTEWPMSANAYANWKLLALLDICHIQ
ncbi:hypothetical protein CC85DRAFT_55762 [Cutaneotrichosporon oleaginosum]|uniref:Uncharacterized protein n=1 Tax=Cutaneotrichosporon oleaginosum TaxID=879819 RepID=A0A0J0XYL8_9TREE|nr:uncharacterized protein CC85DRAFT_55762 [Cutaneotrichosporon oleaginosum]KLT46143.1 hypothetical protein CC85DRAFT_55762 [Cutaneotrichosporon oleaginosum]TXT10153.1 hypothetical protein COLE_04087 [Cutaneotrichosporon oleaginosum]